MDRQRPRIETERFVMRPHRDADFEPWAQLIFADPDVMRYMPVRDLTPTARARRALDVAEASWQAHGFPHLLISDKSDNALIGDCYMEPPEASGSGEAEIGYTIGRDHWGRGIATEAARALVRYSFDHLPLERIVGVVIPDNIGSWRVLEHLGFSYERTTEFYDLEVKVYGLGRDEFDPGDHAYRVSLG